MLKSNQPRVRLDEGSSKYQSAQETCEISVSSDKYQDIYKNAFDLVLIGLGLR